MSISCPCCESEYIVKNGKIHNGKQVFPSKRHQAVGKETGKPNYIGRFNCTMGQEVSRLVRKTLSFSKKIENHMGAIWYFVHHYNTSLHF